MTERLAMMRYDASTCGDNRLAAADDHDQAVMEHDTHVAPEMQPHHENAAAGPAHPQPNRRILFVIADPFPTFRPDVAALFGKYLPRHGIYSDVVAQLAATEHARQRQTWGAGQEFVARRYASRARSVLASVFNDIKALRQARAGQYSAIQVRDKIVSALYGLRVARRLGVPFFYWMSYPMSEGSIEFARTHGARMGLARYLFVLTKGRLGVWLLYRWILPRSDHVFVQSERMRDEVATRGIPLHRMTAVPMGVDAELTASLPGRGLREDRLQGKRVIVYLGTCERVRRIDFLFEVLREVRKSVPAAMLLIAGDAPEKEDRRWLESCAASLGLEASVIWTGWLSTEEAWRHVRRSDVAVSPIPRGFLLDCGSPTKLIEYLALGVPAVANDQPDQARVLKESGGGICVEYDVRAFAEAIVSILRDPSRAADMGRKGRQYAQDARSYERLSRMVAEEYRSRLGSTRSRGSS